MDPHRGWFVHIRWFIRFFLIAMIFLPGGCGLLGPGPAVFHGDADAYNKFLTPTPLVPFVASGTLFIQLGDQKESGEFLLASNDERQLRIQLLARVTGSLGFEVQLGEEQLLLLDYLKNTYFEGENNRRNRLRLFGADISAADFLLMVTGRVSEVEFKAFNGKLSETGYAEMVVGKVRYQFTLDHNGLVKRWSKEEGAKVVYRVEYGPYLLVPTTSGKVLRVPHRIQVFTNGERPTMTLGLQRFRPGLSDQQPITFDAPPGLEWSFKAPPDPQLKAFDNL